MSDDVAARYPIAAVEAGRENGAAGLDPVGFAVIEALARRAARQHGDARQRIMLRIEQLLALHAAKRPGPAAVTGADKRAARGAALADLSALVDRLGRAPGSRAAPAASLHARAARDGEAPASRSDAVTAFKGTWSRLRVEQRLRQAMAQVPAIAGPLNSAQLINRTLQAMRDQSPAYLDAFMQHVDTLLWLEQASGGDLVRRPATPADSARGRDARRVSRKA